MSDSGNLTDKLKLVAEKITSSNYEDGVAQLLEELERKL